MADHPIYTVIMAGGAGTRFWPLSRRARPKQLLPLAGDSGLPMITATLQRVAGLSPPERVVCVTGSVLAEATRAALPTVPPEQILTEPTGRNTAPCVAWASAWIARRAPQGIAVVLAADAHIADTKAFVSALEKAADAARDGHIVTLGIKPNRPETGYGYLHVGEASAHEGVFQVQAFVEKPNAERAQQFLSDGKHLWNAGIFVFRVDVMRQAVRDHLPGIAAAMDRFDEAAKEGQEASMVEALYGDLQSISIDHGVMEKVSNVLVVPVDCGWNDVGSWQVSWELGQPDAQGNVVRAELDWTVLHQATGNLVVAPPGKAVALLGVDDLVVVDTPDALLVVPRAKAQDVKKAVEELMARNKRDAL